jgi:xyloglucan-specific exo-beta-1,4-glucanase
MADSTLPQIANSSDGGNTWSPYPGAPDPSANVYGGKIAMSANGDTLLWSQANNLAGVNYSKNGQSFQRATGVPDGAVIASDKLNNTVFYAGSTTNAAFYISTDGGVTFQQRSFLGSASGIGDIAASPYKAGEIFVSTSRGVWYSTNYGASFTGIPGATEAWSISFGAPKSTGDRGVLYAAATVGGESTLYRTEDLGQTWFKLSTAQKALGSASVMTVAGDPNVYRQVFLGVGGRGVFVGSA